MFCFYSLFLNLCRHRSEWQILLPEKTVSQSSIHKACDSTANAISFLAIESSTLLIKLYRAVIQDLMAGMHVNFDAEECPEVLSVIYIFPPVFARF